MYRTYRHRNRYRKVGVRLAKGKKPSKELQVAKAEVEKLLTTDWLAEEISKLGEEDNG